MAYVSLSNLVLLLSGLFDFDLRVDLIERSNKILKFSFNWRGGVYCPDYQCWVYSLIFLIKTILLVSFQKGYSRIISTEYDEEEMDESGTVTTQNYKLCFCKFSS